MKILNKDTFKKKKYNVFITSYVGLDYFNGWSSTLKGLEDIQLIIIDSGNQSVAKEFPFPVYQTSRNIGCAGCWNLIAYIGFELYGLDQIIIGQDDAKFTSEMVKHIWQETTDDILPGAYTNGFEFSCFGLTKKFYETVGMFDENFVYFGCEDNDYTHRLQLFNKRLKCLNYSSIMNNNITTRKIEENIQNGKIYNIDSNIRIYKEYYNVIYLHKKWGTNYEYRNPFNDASKSPTECDIHLGLTNIYGNVVKFPSLVEIENLQKELCYA